MRRYETGSATRVKLLPVREQNIEMDSLEETLTWGNAGSGAPASFRFGSSTRFALAGQTTSMISNSRKAR